MSPALPTTVPPRSLTEILLQGKNYNAPGFISQIGAQANSH